jgi:phage terminase large subunit-like protein
VKLLKHKHIPEQYVRTKSDKAFIDQGGTFDIKRGERVVNFIQKFVRPTRGLAAEKTVKLLPWQRDELIIPLFSWIKPDNYRRFTRGLLGIPRQNGKSFITSAIGCYMLMADNEPASYVVVSATQRKQTKIVFSEIVHTIQCNRDLAAATVIKESTNTVVYPAKRGRLEGVSNENWGQLGDPPHCFIADEFAFWDNYDPWTAVDTGSGSRNQPLYLAITTAGTDRTTKAYDLWKHAEAVQSSLIADTSFFPLVYAAKPDDDIHAEQTWKRCNPSLGHFLKADDFRAWSERAKRSKIEELNFRQFKLNEWVASVNQFINLDRWADCTLGGFPDLDGLDAYVGIDLSSTQDLTSVVVVIPHQGRYYVLHHSFCCIETVRKREAQNATRYTVFEQEGTLTVHSGNAIDLEDVRAYVREVARKYNVRSIGIDIAHNAVDTFTILQAEGLPITPFVCMATHTNTPMRRLSDLVNDRKLAHQGDSLLNWQVQNLESKTVGRELLSPTKPSNDAKIDTMTALIIAVAGLVKGEAEPKPSTTIELW